MQKPDAKQQAAYYILRNQLIEHNYRGNFGIEYVLVILIYRHVCVFLMFYL